MHILTIPSSYPHPSVPYSGIFFKEQAEAIHHQGVQVGVIAPIRRSVRTLLPSSLQYVPKSQFPTYLREYFSVPKLPKLNDWRHLRIGLSLYREYESKHGTPDLIHAHSALLGGELARRISEITGVPYLVTEHSSAFGLNLLTDRELQIASSVFAGAQKLIAVSNSLARDIELVVPHTSGRWECIPNSVSEIFEARRGQNHAGGSFTFLTVSDLNKNKNIGSLLRAFASIDRSYGFELKIGGQGDDLAELRQLVNKLNIADRVHFLGRLSRSEVSYAMQECNAFVLASRYETFGVVLVEALAHGKPIIATACGGPESIVNSRNGILVPVDDLASMRQAMLKIYLNQSQFNADHMRQDCLARFGSRNIACKVISGRIQK